MSPNACGRHTDIGITPTQTPILQKVVGIKTP
jgi:hypothetical protein